MQAFLFDLQRFNYEADIQLNSKGFSAEISELITTTNVQFSKKLKVEIKAEAEAEIADYPSSSASLETFKEEAKMSGGNSEKDKLPEKVWQAIMQGAIAKSNAISSILSLIGLNIDSKTIKAVGGYLYEFLSDDSVTVKDGSKTYTVSVTAYSTATVKVGSKTYNVNWITTGTLFGKSAAQKALDSYLKELKNYFKNAYVDAWVEISKGGLNDVLDDVFNNLGAKYDGIANSIYDAIKTYVQETTGKEVDSIFSVFKKDSAPIKTIKALDKNYSAFLKKANALKNYLGKTSTYNETVEKKFNALITAYNKLGLETKIDDLINDYLPANLVKGTSGDDTTENERSNVFISTGAGDDSIINSGSQVTLKAGSGNDSISLSSSSYYNVIIYKSGDGNDSISGFNSDDTLQIGGGKGTYSSTKSGDDLIVTVGKGKISLNGAASLSDVNIEGVYNDPTILTVTKSTKSPVTVGSAVKVIDASKRTKAVQITGNKSANSIVGGSKGDTLNGSKGHDIIYGNAGSDILFGETGKDSLFGGKGNDCLVGGKGNDSLWGDTGADNFIYSSGDGKDVIFGFDNKDTLTFDALDFKASYKNEAVILKVNGGSVTLKDFTATTFHINNDVYQISGSKFVKK